MATDPHIAFPMARAAYERGASLWGLKRKLHLTDEELRDACPEEFPDDPEPEGAGGY